MFLGEVKYGDHIERFFESITVHSQPAVFFMLNFCLTVLTLLVTSTHLTFVLRDVNFSHSQVLAAELKRRQFITKSQ